MLSEEELIMNDRYHNEQTTETVDKEEYDNLVEEKENIKNRLEELTSVVKEIFKTKTDKERLDKVEEIFEWCKENKYI